jgi:hypothetical protein
MLSRHIRLQHSILGFANGTALRQLLALPNYFGIVTINILLQRNEKMKVTCCQDPTQNNRWKHCCSNLDGSVSEHPPYSPDFATDDFSAMINTNVASISNFY